MSRLTFLEGDTRNLGNLKSVINKACDKIGLPRILVTGAGRGTACSHEITRVDPQPRDWILEIAGKWDLEADPTAVI